MPYNDRIPDTPAPLGAPTPRPSTTPAKPLRQIAPGVLEGPDGKFYTELPDPQPPTTQGTSP